MERRIDDWFSFAVEDESVKSIDQVATEVRQIEGVKLGVFTIVVREDSVALVQLSYGAELYGGFPWSLPGGSVGSSELPSAAARREVLEETGLALSEERLQTAAVFHRPYVTDVGGCKIGELTLLYCCRVDDSTRISPNSPEILNTSFAKYDLDQWLAVPASGSGELFQPLRRHWIYWTKIGMQKLESTGDRSIKLWTYDDASQLALPII